MGQHQNVLIMLKCYFVELGISLTSIPQILIAVTMFFLQASVEMNLSSYQTGL